MAPVPAEDHQVITQVPQISGKPAEARTLEQRRDQLPRTKRVVKESFKNTPALYAVAKCESRWTHFHDDGTVLRGRINNNDVGVMQINERYHRDKAESLGYDIDTLKGNIGYAKYLYRNQGLQPWSASRHCWKHSRKLVRK